MKNSLRLSAWLAVAAAVAMAATAIIIVDETEQAVVTQFGRPTAVYREAGLYFKAPAPIQRVSTFDKRTLITETRETELLTADKKNVVVSGYLSWRIADPLLYLQAVRTREFAEARLTALVQSELGSAFGDLPFATLVADSAERQGLEPLERGVEAACARVAHDDYGIEVVAFGVTRLNFPPQNLQSVFARMRAERARIARGYRSEGKAEAAKIRAGADRERAELLATAEANATRIRGEGDAEAAHIYSDAYSNYEQFYRFVRTLESYEKVLGENTTLVLPADSPFLDILMKRGGQPR